MAVAMNYAPGFNPAALHMGTELFLCHRTRRVRVLTLPVACGNRTLRYSWEDCFGCGADDLVDWPIDLRLLSKLADPHRN